jgi:hypothetical protein
MTNDIERLQMHHKTLHDLYVKVATQWELKDPMRAPMLDLISSVLELVETAKNKAQH